MSKHRSMDTALKVIYSYLSCFVNVTFRAEWYGPIQTIYVNVVLDLWYLMLNIDCKSECNDHAGNTFSLLTMKFRKSFIDIWVVCIPQSARLNVPKVSF